MNPERIFTGAPWEKKVGYCRAIRSGSTIAVTGTVALDEAGRIFAPGDAYAQAKRSLETIEKAIKPLGAERHHIIRTRIFVTDISVGRNMDALTANSLRTVRRPRRWSRLRTSLIRLH